MKTHTLTVTVQIKVESDLPIEQLIDNFGSETNYDFGSTEEVKVISTEITEVN